MSKLLHIEASPRGERSASITVAQRFLDAYRAKNPGDTVETLDIWKTSLPEFNGDTIDAKYAVLTGQKPTPEQVRLLEQWNFGIPYKLKHFIDVLVQPGLTFTFTPSDGFKGLVTGRPTAVIYARGGAYGPGSGAEGYDNQSAYLRQVLGFIGITGLQEIFVEPTSVGTGKNDAVNSALAKAEALAATF